MPLVISESNERRKKDFFVPFNLLLFFSFYFLLFCFDDECDSDYILVNTLYVYN